MISKEQNYENGADKVNIIQNLDNISPLSTQVPWIIIICGLTLGSVFASAPFVMLYLLSLLTSPSRLVSYFDSNNGIKIERPLNWEVRRIDNKFIGDVLQLIPPKAENSSFREAVTISIENFSGTFTEYRQSEVQDIQLHLQSASVTINRPSTLAKHKALELEYITKEGSKTTKYWKKSALYNKKVYTITYVANVDDYNKYFQTVERMAQTFDIKP
jgi:eukaryotic-like serine/threonine-protein kinase